MRDTVARGDRFLASSFNGRRRTADPNVRAARVVRAVDVKRSRMRRAERCSAQFERFRSKQASRRVGDRVRTAGQDKSSSGEDTGVV